MTFQLAERAPNAKGLQKARVPDLAASLKEVEAGKQRRQEIAQTAGRDDMDKKYWQKT